MKLAQVHLQQAYLLHSRPYRDSSLLVNLLSEEFGHISAVVYVGKGKSSAKKGQLQPFARLTVELKGKHTLKTLSRIEFAQKSLTLQGHHLYSGFYLNELMVRLLPENIPCESLFTLYHQTLNKLSQADAIEPLLRRFEMTLLQELGLSLDFSVLSVPRTEPTVAEEIQFAKAMVDKWHYIPEEGFIPAQIGIQYPLYDGEHLRQIGCDNFHAKDILLTCKLLMRQVLQMYLGNKPLHSRKLFNRKISL
ncbi:DNA repair protein RecO [Thalassotalea aquiviva]|uniref:DNA repair protein RecO n=1 Tax=Thalassotalea aquiviva TaxID=3242415 RepID=UPI00352A6370